MELKISILDEVGKEEYEKYILQKENSLIYVSVKYQKLLEELLNDKSYYLVAKENECIMGVLPCFLRENNKYGNILNSLPFYGSTGSIICDNQRIREKLLMAYYQLSKDFHCVASTMITSPFEKDIAWYKKNIEPQFIDERIGQITFFPAGDEGESERLWHAIDAKNRNSIKKAKKSGVVVEIDNSSKSIDFLYKCHMEGMEKIGGLAKKKKFFDLIEKIFNQGTEYNIYTAKLDGKRISSCLLLYYNGTVEYFVPITAEGYRTYQPLSLIIFEAMKDAMLKGFKRWNWGGTWLTQKGVYDFKRKWGTTDLAYYYFVNIFDKTILKVDKEDILTEYENYFVYPFSAKLGEKTCE